MIEEGQDPNDLEPDYTDSESEGTEFNLEKDEFAEMFSFDNDKRADKKFYRSGKNKHEKEIGTDTGNGKNIPTLLPRVGGLKYRMPLKMHYREYDGLRASINSNLLVYLDRRNYHQQVPNLKL